LEETRIRAWTDAPASAAFRPPYLQDSQFTPVAAYSKSQQHQQQHRPQQQQRSTPQHDPTPPLRLTAAPEASNNNNNKSGTNSVSNSRTKPMPEVSSANQQSVSAAVVPERNGRHVGGQTHGKRSAAWNIDAAVEKAAAAAAAQPTLPMSFEDAGFF